MFLARHRPAAWEVIVTKLILDQKVFSKETMLGEFALPERNKKSHPKVASFCGAGESRTPVQTGNSNAFYIFSL